MKYRSMQIYHYQGHSRILYTIFFIAACSLRTRTATALQSRRFSAFRRDIQVLDSCGRGSVCCGAFRKKQNFENDCTKEDFNEPPHISYFSRKRRDLLLSTSSSFLGVSGIYQPDPAQAVDVFGRKGLYVLNTRDSLSESSLGNEQVQVFPKLSSEVALLKVLPVKNTVFRTVEQNLESLSVLRYRRETSKENIDKAWARACSSVDTALTIIINKRNQLEPVFNPDDSAEVAAVKAERGEKLLGDLTQDLKYLEEAIDQRVCKVVYVSWCSFFWFPRVANVCVALSKNI